MSLKLAAFGTDPIGGVRVVELRSVGTVPKGKGDECCGVAAAFVV